MLGETRCSLRHLCVHFFLHTLIEYICCCSIAYLLCRRTCMLAKSVSVFAVAFAFGFASTFAFAFGFASRTRQTSSRSKRKKWGNKGVENHSLARHMQSWLQGKAEEPFDTVLSSFIELHVQCFYSDYEASLHTCFHEVQFAPQYALTLELRKNHKMKCFNVQHPKAILAWTQENQQAVKSHGSVLFCLASGARLAPGNKTQQEPVRRRPSHHSKGTTRIAIYLLWMTKFANHRRMAGILTSINLRLFAVI